MACLAIAAPAAPDPQRTIESLPAWFEEHSGGGAGQARFVSRGSAGTLLLDPAGARFVTRQADLRLSLKGARPAALIGVDPLAGRSSYLVGSDRRQWRRGVVHYAKVRAQDVYPGVDVVYYLRGSELEYDFQLAPGADPGNIRLSFSGAGRPALDANGDLLFAQGIRHRRPLAYQETPEGRRPVDARYRLDANGDIRFALGPYDRTQRLTIDPVLYAGYVGGDREEIARALALDPEGNVWITGSSSSAFIVHGQVEPIQFEPAGRRDVFIAKLTPDASGKLNLVYWNQFGGSDSDEANAIVVTGSGFVYVAGRTASLDFPRAGGALQDALGELTDAFVAQLRPTDSGLDALWYSQFYGGDGADNALALAVDGVGDIYVAGSTTSGELPGATGPVVQGANRGGMEGFLFKVSPGSSSPLVYGTFFGGQSTDVITALTLDPSGDVYIAGYTSSEDFPVTVDAYQVGMRSSMDAFLVRLDLRIPGLDGLLYGTYIGGFALDIARAMIPAEGGVWLTGYTLSEDFPITAGAHRENLAGAADIFLLRFDYSRRSTTEALAYSTLLGGASDDVPYALAAGPDGTLAIAGYTYSTDFPLVGSPAPTPKAGPNAEVFVSLVDPAREGGAGIRYSSVFGGGYGDIAAGLAVDAAGNIYIAGYSQSFDFPVTDESRKVTPGGAAQSFVVRATAAGN